MSKDREHERPDDVVGHKTLRDGTHLPLRRDEAEALRAAADAAQAAREALMPTERAAISILFDAWLRLKDMGWREAIYCPKDGSSFDVIEAGSTGIHRCHYEGKWPEGCWWIEDHGDLSPSHPMLFRLDPEAEAARPVHTTPTTTARAIDHRPPRSISTIRTILAPAIHDAISFREKQTIARVAAATVSKRGHGLCGGRKRPGL